MKLTKWTFSNLICFVISLLFNIVEDVIGVVLILEFDVVCGIESLVCEEWDVSIVYSKLTDVAEAGKFDNSE